MAEEPRKRSRFDQVEPPRKSRFDRRSRSPADKDLPENRRSRSPPKQTNDGADTGAAGGSGDGDGEHVGKDPTAAAAAAAAKINAQINAQINAKKGIQHVDVPPIRSNASPAAARSPSQQTSSTPLNDEIYTQDGDYIKDIEVNDLRNRYTLTKGSTQKMIKEETGADVTTRGNYYPDKSLATAAAPPLYLHVTSTSKEGLEKAVKKINELMTHELPNLIDERRFRRREPEPFERDHLGRKKWPEERIPIDLEPIPGFNLRAQVVGAGGSYVKHIQTETGCRVQIKGRGSGFMERETDRESEEEMYLHVAGRELADIERAKALCLELLEVVRTSYAEFKDRPSRGSGGGGSGGYGHDDQSRGGYAPRDRNNGGYGGNGSYGGNNQYGGAYSQAPPSYGAGAAMSPQASGQGSMNSSTGIDQAQYQAWATYYAQNPQADPYAAYGGYAAMMAHYMQPQAQQGYYSAQSSNGIGAPPGVPDDGNVPPPPPPPPPGGSGTSYNAMPAPPGL